MWKQTFHIPIYQISAPLSMQIGIPILSKSPDGGKLKYRFLRSIPLSLWKIMTLLEVSGVLYTDSNGLILFFPLWGDVTLHSSLGGTLQSSCANLHVWGRNSRRNQNSLFSSCLSQTIFSLEFPDIFRHTEWKIKVGTNFPLGPQHRQIRGKMKKHKRKYLK